MQKNRSKRYRAAAQQVDRTKAYDLAGAIATLKKFSPTKFDQTVTVSLRLGVDPKQSDQMVRGTCPLPHGSGKQVRVLVFAEGEAAKAAREAGAEFVRLLMLRSPRRRRWRKCENLEKSLDRAD
jgi:large subunit ribosomal protein L1